MRHNYIIPFISMFYENESANRLEKQTEGGTLIVTVWRVESV